MPHVSKEEEFGKPGEEHVLARIPAITGSLLAKTTYSNDVLMWRYSPSINFTSFPCFWRNSISCCVKVVMDMDFTLCGGFKPRLERERAL